MLILLTVILGLSCLAAGLYIHHNNEAAFDDVYITRLTPSIDNENTNTPDQRASHLQQDFDSAQLLDDILENADSKQALLSFTQVSQRRDKQIPLLGLPDKALFHIH